MNNSENKQYNKKEVSLILKRAVEIQRKSTETEIKTQGLTSVDLEKIAKEVGIDTNCLNQAIEEMDYKKGGVLKASGNKFTGAPLTITLRKTIDGELPKSEFENLLPVIQNVTNDIHGQVSVIGKTFTWQLKDTESGKAIQVLINVKQGKTNIQVQSNRRQTAGGLFGGLMGGMGLGMGLSIGFSVGLGALQSVLFTVCFPLCTVGFGYLLARTIYKYITKKQQRQLKKLTDALGKKVEELIP